MPPAARPRGAAAQAAAKGARKGSAKPKYSEVVDGAADRELVEMVERDILDTNPNVCLPPPTYRPQFCEQCVAV